MSLLERGVKALESLADAWNRVATSNERVADALTKSHASVIPANESATRANDSLTALDAVRLEREKVLLQSDIEAIARQKKLDEKYNIK